MLNIKVGMFPGEIKNYVVEDNSTVGTALELAGITIGTEQDVKMNSETVNTSDFVTDNALILVTKRIKGNR